MECWDRPLAGVIVEGMAGENAMPDTPVKRLHYEVFSLREFGIWDSEVRV